MRRSHTAIIALLVFAAAGVHPVAQAATSTLAVTPTYGPTSIEPQDPGYQYRGMPSMQYVTWVEGGVTKARFIRSFQISPDDGTLRTRIQYHVGGSMTNTANWLPALDTAGNQLLASTEYAKVNNVYKSLTGATVAIDERVTGGGANRRLTLHSSANGGVNWATTTAPVDMTGEVVGDAGRAFQRVIRLPDDTLVLPYYVSFLNGAGQVRYSAHLLVSDDDGANWRRAATPFKSETISYSESTVARRSDGKLVMIARHDVVASNGDRQAKLASRVTTTAVNDAAGLAAAAWGPLTSVVVPGTSGVGGAAPVLHTMEGGVLLLAFGRPRNNVTFSDDGGASWLAAHSFYDNIPTAGCTTGLPAGSGTQYPCDALGSSGYLGIAVTSPSTAYVIGDNCHTNWGCYADYTYPHGRDDKLWYATLGI